MKMYKKIISLLTIGILSSSMMVGCRKEADSTKVLNIYNVGDYIDESLIKKFETETGIKVLHFSSSLPCNQMEILNHNLYFHFSLFDT